MNPHSNGVTACLATTVALLLLLAAPARADEAKLRRALAKAMPGAQVESIVPSPIKGMYEVFVNGEIVYLDPTGQFALTGNLIEVASMKNLTHARKEKLLSVPFNTLPLDLAVKTVKGDGRRVFAAFEDPNCVYCKEMHKSLESMTDYTLYTFMVPFLGPDSEAKLRAIWCSADPAQAFQGTLRGTAKLEVGICEVPVAQLSALAERLRVRGTPTLYFTDGSRSPGLMTLAQLEQRLNAAAGAQTARAKTPP